MEIIQTLRKREVKNVNVHVYYPPTSSWSGASGGFAPMSCVQTVFDLPLCVCVAPGVVVDEIVRLVYYETHIELHMWLRLQINIHIKVLICDLRKV